MTNMISVQIRFAPEELKRIDNHVKTGEYPSRAEFIRDAVRKAEMFRLLETMGEILEKEEISMDELMEEGSNIRKKLYKEMFGEDQ